MKIVHLPCIFYDVNEEKKVSEIGINLGKLCPCRSKNWEEIKYHLFIPYKNSIFKYIKNQIFSFPFVKLFIFIYLE